MNTSPNIKFNYLYRDAGNYKQFGCVIFSNPQDLSLDQIEGTLRGLLIDQEFFDPDQWQLPRLKFDDWDVDLDHTWNEYECLEFTAEASTQPQSISDFLVFLSTLKRVH